MRKVWMMTLLLAVAGSLGVAQQQPLAAAQPQAAVADADKVVETEVLRLSAEAAAAGDKVQFTVRHPRYELRAGDAMNLVFPFTPELNQTVSVQPDGYITLREVGDLYVGGMTLPELRKALGKEYGKMLRDPKISVELTTFEKPFFLASGELQRPGRYEMTGEISVVQAIAQAGGFTDSAKHSQVLLRRINHDQVQVRKIDVKRMLASGDLREDVYLHPGDLLYVPKNMLSKLKDFVIPRMVFGATLRGLP
jgi:polysaccharide export outer membrane protein